MRRMDDHEDTSRSSGQDFTCEWRQKQRVIDRRSVSSEASRQAASSMVRLIAKGADQLQSLDEEMKLVNVLGL